VGIVIAVGLGELVTVGLRVGIGVGGCGIFVGFKVGMGVVVGRIVAVAVGLGVLVAVGIGVLVGTATHLLLTTKPKAPVSS